MAGEAEPAERGSAHLHVPSIFGHQPGGGRSGKPRYNQEEIITREFLIIKAGVVVVLLKARAWGAVVGCESSGSPRTWQSAHW